MGTIHLSQAVIPPGTIYPIRPTTLCDEASCSIEPYEDCCTVFTPRHPRTRPDLKKVLVQEQKLPFDELVEEALANMYRVDVTPEGYEVRQ